MRHFVFLLAILLASCHNESTDQFDAFARNDQPMAKPLPGEWRWEHEEKHQSFKDFAASKPIKASAQKRTIVLQPIGTFSPLQQRQISLLKTYLEAFFQLPVRVDVSVSNDRIPKDKRRIGQQDFEQLDASYILNSVLSPQKSKDAVALMGISELDLYPKPEWNYVFGLASYSKQVGVTSIFRLQDDKLTNENFELCQVRLIKISSHEIGHMFGIHHCLDANCVMNGANHLPETDKQTTRLCSHCQRKLHYGIGYDAGKRLSALIGFFERNGISKESIGLKKDLAASAKPN